MPLTRCLAVDLKLAPRDEAAGAGPRVQVQRRRLPGNGLCLDRRTRRRAGAGNCPPRPPRRLLMRLLRITRGGGVRSLAAAGPLGAAHADRRPAAAVLTRRRGAGRGPHQRSARHGIRNTVHALPPPRPSRPSRSRRRSRARPQRLGTGPARQGGPPAGGPAGRGGTRPDDADHARRRDLTLTECPTGRPAHGDTPAAPGSPKLAGRARRPVPARHGEPTGPPPGNAATTR